MNKKFKLNTLSLLIVTSLTGGLAGCIEEKKLNTDTVVYEPEERPLGVIAGEGAEYEPGSSVTLSGRLVGTTNGQTTLWTQISGSPIEGVTDWTSPEITFLAPEVIGIEAFVFQLIALESDGSAAVDDEDNPLVDETTVTVFDPATKVFYQVEDDNVSELVGIELCATDDCLLTGAQGTHTQDFTPGASVKYTLNVEEDTFVTLYGAFGIPSSGYGSKNAIINVNGVDSEITVGATGGFSEYRIGVIKLNAGDNVIEVGGGWNYYRLDYLMTVPAAQPVAPLPVPATLVNVNASDEALALIEFLALNYSTSTLSGQTEFPESATPLAEFDKVVAATGGDSPAIVAFDYMNYSSSTTGSVNTSLTESMIDAKHNKNVILSALFHWRAPSGGAAFYTNDTTFDVAAALADTSSAEYAELLVDIDIIAVELKKLADADIPVLWRPLHEAQGEWFWWGAKGSTVFKELWTLMYERLTDHHGLNNLIWVFTHTSDLNEDWYPGDNMVDIVGYDGYADPSNDDEATFTSQFSTLKSRHDGKKLVALTETGTIPNVATMHEQNAWWSFFITWNTETWDADSVIGPGKADPATIKENYAADGVLNLDDVPGGRAKIEAGVYDSFDVSIVPFSAQINWGDTSAIQTSANWATSGARALSVVKDLSAETDPTDVILQTYPEGGIDVTDVAMLKVSGNAINAGAGTTIKLWAKDADGAWRDAGASTIVDGGVELELDISDLDTLQGFGFQIQGFDASSTAAEFLLDNVRLDDSVIYDFEPQTSGYSGQINWGDAPGLTVTNDWATSGKQALTMVKDLSALTEPTDVIIQTYPAGGIDVTGVSLLKVSGNAIDAGAGTTIKLWAKDSAGSWRDAGETTVVEGGVELEIDISDIDIVSGFGFQINGIDVTSTNARFYLDNVRLDDMVVNDFEGTGSWEFQNNWSPVMGIQLAQNWVANGENSLSGVTQLVDGDDDVILQVYPEGGLLLGDVDTISITANAKDAGAVLQAMLFVKDQDGEWSDSGAVDVVDGGITISFDISALKELSGFGIRFMGPKNSVTPARFYIDTVEFSKAAAQ